MLLRAEAQQRGMGEAGGRDAGGVLRPRGPQQLRGRPVARRGLQAQQRRVSRLRLLARPRRRWCRCAAVLLAHQRLHTSSMPLAVAGIDQRGPLCPRRFPIGSGRGPLG